MKRFLAAPLVLLLCAYATPQHSKVDTKLTFDKDDATFVLQVVPNDGMALTFDTAPWKLSLENAEGLMVERKDLTWTAKEVDQKTGAFTIKGKAKPNGKFSFKLNAFVCTKDKTRCYPQMHKKDLTWANKQLKPS